jgi:hypothetical protein
MKVTTTLERLLKQSNKMKQRMVKSLLKTMRDIDRQRKERVADLDQAARIIGKELADLGHKVGVGNDKPTKARATNGKASTKGKRVRRTPEQLKAEAEKALATIRKSGKEGVSGKDIRKVVPGIGQNIKAFIEQNAGEKVRTTGAKASMRYHA